MIAVKVQCDCGQRYAFDVEPVNGRMPTSVVCPLCGADGTPAANNVIAQNFAAQPPPPPPAPVFARVNAPAAPLATPVALAAPTKPPPIPAAAVRPTAVRPAIAQAKAGKDGWASEETGFHKLGTYITTLPPVLATVIPWTFAGMELPVLPMCIVMAVCGLIGGIINVWGRGPIVAGAIIGLFISLGAYGAVAYWIHDKISVNKLEMVLAFLIGAAPGFLLQVVIQKILKKRAATA